MRMVAVGFANIEGTFRYTYRVPEMLFPIAFAEAEKQRDPKYLKFFGETSTHEDAPKNEALPLIDPQ